MCCRRRRQRRGCWGQRPSSALVTYPGRFLGASERGSPEGLLDPAVKQDRQGARLSKQTGGKPLACMCRSNKPGPHVQTQINILLYAHTPPLSHMHTHTFHSPVTPFSLCVLCLAFYMDGKRNTASKHTLKAHNQYYDRLFVNTVKGVRASTHKARALSGFLCCHHTEGRGNVHANGAVPH